MSDHNPGNSQPVTESRGDAVFATLAILIPVMAIVYWLQGMPS